MARRPCVAASSPRDRRFSGCRHDCARPCGVAGCRPTAAVFAGDPVAGGSSRLRCLALVPRPSLIDRGNRNGLPRVVIYMKALRVGVVCLTVLVGCDVSIGTPQSEMAAEPSPASQSAQPSPTFHGATSGEKKKERVRCPGGGGGGTAKKGGRTVELWYALNTDTGVGMISVAVQRRIPDTPGVAAATLRAWIKGPTCSEREAGVASSVPRGTRLLGISISQGTATIDLSSEFERTALGTLYEGLLLEQLAWTITQFPTVERALLKIDGEFKDYYLGHGYIIDETHPLTRN